MSGETVVVINPISGKRDKGPVRKERVDQLLRTYGWKVRSCLTEYAGHAPLLTREAVASGARRVISVGGDGTINEVARELVGSGVEFGLVPMGSGNGLARHLGLPLDFGAAMRVAMEGAAKPIDAGMADGHAFFNVMGIGFDAEIGKRFNDNRARGFASYVKIGFEAFKSYKEKEYTVRTEGAEERIGAFMIAVANSSQYGSNAYIAPDAEVDDGLLNFVAVSSPGVLGALMLTWRLFMKKTYGSGRVKSLRGESFVISLGEPGFFHADGEIFECGEEIEVKVKEKSLLVAQ